MSNSENSIEAFGYQRSQNVYEFPGVSFGMTKKDWELYAQKRLEQLIRLSPGWDGYEGKPVSFNTAYFALQMLTSICTDDTVPPQIVPGADGNLQIEWHLQQGDIELEVRSPNQVIAWRITPETGPDGQEVRLRNNFQQVANWLKQITEPAIAPNAAAA